MQTPRNGMSSTLIVSAGDRRHCCQQGDNCSLSGDFPAPPANALYQETAMFDHIRKFVAEDSGATAIEYGLIAALISVAIITAATALGSGLSATFNSVAQQVSK
jgi:pilus assembly protein Flp/PilA